MQILLTSNHNLLCCRAGIKISKCLLIKFPVHFGAGNRQLFNRIFHRHLFLRLILSYLCQCCLYMFAKFKIFCLCLFRLPDSLMQRNLFFVLTIIFLKDIVCHIRCVNRIQLKDSKKTVIQRSLTRSAIFFSMLLWLIKAFFCNFNIKIAEIAPKKLINFMACLSNLKFV